MRLHNLGIEQTANAWKVAQALLLLQQQQQEPSDVNRSNKHSFEAALEHLTHRIANLRPPTTMQVTAAAATTTERPTNIAATPLPADAAAVPVPVRIVAVSNTPSMKDNATSVATTTHRSSKFKKSKCALTSTTTASTNKVNHAKEAQPLSRTRSDSVTEAVASKLTAAAAAIDSSSSKLTAVAGTVVNTNNKRSRNNSTSTTDSNVAGEGGVGIEGPLLSPSPSSSFGGTNAKRTRRANSMSNNNNNMNNSKVE